MIRPRASGYGHRPRSSQLLLAANLSPSTTALASSGRQHIVYLERWTCIRLSKPEQPSSSISCHLCARQVCIATSLIFFADVLKVLHRSSSMANVDRLPLPNQPSTPIITQFNNNRFGAVLSAIYGFWISRASGSSRPDAYSAITFDDGAQVCIRPPAFSRLHQTYFLGGQIRFANDLSSTPDHLLAKLVQVRAGGVRRCDGAIALAQVVMDTHWSAERYHRRLMWHISANNDR